jgi:hypothetical protein
LIGEINQSNIVQAIRREAKKSRNARRKDEGEDSGLAITPAGPEVGIGLSRRGEGGGSCGFRVTRRRGEGAALADVRTFTGELVRLMEDV